ncbi:MAG: universal stress protein [Ignavibacteriales bacterium]
MREIKKIVWATDGSKESDEALNYARLFAQRFNSEIISISVIPMTKSLLSYYSREPDSELYRWVDKAAEEHKTRFASIADELSTQGLRFRGEILKGEPNKEIVGLAGSEKADLIVMGKRGHGLIDRILVGNTTIKVLRESNIPVLAVGKKDKEGAIEIRNILVPVDTYEKTDSALNYAIDLARNINASISVLYALSAYYYETYYVDVMKNLIKFYSDELARRVKEVKLKRGIGDGGTFTLEINTEVIEGISPSVTIVEYASSKNTDLIVMNTHGRKGIKRFILGSITEKVIQESPCPVLALRP